MSQTESGAPVPSGPAALDQKLAWLRGAATTASGWFTGTGAIWRGSVAVSGIALLTAFLGREGLLFASSMEVAALTAGGVAPDGIIYYLPKSVIEVQATFQLLRCDARPATANAPPVVTIDARVSPRASPMIKSDLSRGYVIKANTISGGFWNTDMKVELVDGRLVRLGVRHDSTVVAPRPGVPIAANVMARITPPGPGPELTPEQQAARERVCGKATVDALDHPTPANADLLSLTRRFRLEPGGPCPAASETIDSPSRFSCVLRGSSTIGSMLASPGEVAAQLAHYDLLLQLSDIERSPVRAPALNSGIVYRMPGSAKFMTCLAGCEGASARVLSEETISVPQFGTEAVIPIERRLFSNRTTELEFGASGELKSIHFVDVATEEKKKDTK